MAGLLDLTGFLSPVITRLADYIPDPAEKAKAITAANTEMLGFIAAQNAGQTDIDKAEAANPSVFVAGWRPFIGWVCGAGLAWVFVLGPIAGYILTLTAPSVRLPVIPTDGLMELVTAMLGFGGLRTYEKIKGVSGGNH